MRFIDYENLRQKLVLFENLLEVKIDEQGFEFQEELCFLQSDISLKLMKQKGVIFSKMLDKDKYPCLRDFGLRINSMFSLTYTYETSVSEDKKY